MNRKKVKLITDLPPVQNGVLSASNTPTIDEGRMVDITIDKYSEWDCLDLFFDDSERPTESSVSRHKIADRAMDIVKSNNASEEELRDAIFTDLLESHNIQFLPSSISQNKDSNTNTKYTESYLSVLLAAFGKK